MHADGVNATFVYGFGRFPGQSNNHDAMQYRKVEAVKFASDYTYVSGTTAGMVHPLVDAFEGTSNYFDPPPCYCSEWTKSLVFLHTPDDSALSWVVCERINTVDPESLTKFTRYRTANPPEQTLISAADSWRTYLHMPEEPTVTGNTVEWQTAGGQDIKQEWLSPDVADVTIAVVDESTLSPYDVQPSELAWRTETSPNTDVQWNFILHVGSRRDVGETHTATKLTGTNDSIGVLITRSGNDDRVVVFNGTESDDALIGTFPTMAQAESAAAGIRCVRPAT